MADNFDDITKGFNEKGNQGEHDAPKTVWEAAQLFWPQIMGEGIPIKGVFLVEFANSKGRREIYFGTNPDATDWDIKGLLHQALDTLREENIFGGVYSIVNEIVNDDEDDEEDEQ